MTVANGELSGAGAFEGPLLKVPVSTGIELAYRRFGTGRPLLLLTGSTTAMTIWTPSLLQALARHFRVTIVDYRGVGASTDDAAPMTVRLLADDIAGFMEAVGLQGAPVVGWSLGGQVALAMAERHPSVVNRIVTSGGDAGSAQTVPPVGGEAMLDRFADPTTPPTELLAYLFPSGANEAVTKFVTEYASIPQTTISAETLRRQVEAEKAFFRTTTVWDGLPKVKAHVLVTNGAEDVVVPPVNARRLAQRIPGAKLELFDGAGHAMMFQDVERFVQVVRDFVD